MHSLIPSLVVAVSTPAGDVPAVPISGTPFPGAERLDEIVLKHLNVIGCEAAELSVSSGGRILHRRAYGWSDQARTVPMKPDVLMGIASCEKPIANAAARALAARGRLKLDRTLAEIYGIQPEAGYRDPRFPRVTVRHLLEHQGGWGKDPVGQLPAADRLPFLEWDHHVPQLLASIARNVKFESDPGSTAAYCNLGYSIVRDVLTRTLGRHFIEFYRSGLLPGTLETGIYSTTNVREATPRNAVWNAGQGGPVWATSDALCRFMAHYWANGERRGSEAFTWQMNGSLDGSTALMYWRPDGIDYAVIFNGRSPQAGHDAIREDLNRALDAIDMR
ncbi:MAG TPA: serine hydrolase domain-containing protein [Fimbriimonas sp.]